MKAKTIILVVLAVSITFVAGAGIMLWNFLSSTGGSNSFALGVVLGLGESAMEAKQYGLAEQAFSKALSIAKNGKDNKSDLAEALTRLGQCARRLNKPALAADYFDKAAKLYDEADSEFMFSVERRIWLKCLLEYADLLRESGKSEEAEHLATKIRELKEKLGPVEEFRQKTSEL